MGYSGLFSTRTVFYFVTSLLRTVIAHHTLINLYPHYIDASVDQSLSFRHARSALKAAAEGLTRGRFVFGGRARPL